jgi:hypothetical protein
MPTIAATVNDVRPVDAIGLAAHERAAPDRAQRLSRGQTAAVAMSIALGVVPAGIDGGLVAVVVLDLVLTWIWHSGRGFGSSCGLSVGTAVAGWPDYWAARRGAADAAGHDRG